jgi:hypothetical protein
MLRLFALAIALASATLTQAAPFDLPAVLIPADNPQSEAKVEAG